MVRNVSLSAADLRSGVPLAATLPAGLGQAAELQSAAVSLDR
ncbi:MAG: hypothetical protein RQ752_09370 [Thermohalobaculum sp.]|nr:hypothetical protein [Thermohalobaculum sp.]